MNKKIALILACCAAASFVSCNETVDWNFVETCDEGAKRCYDSSVQVCQDSQWVVETACKDATPVCDPETFTCTSEPVVNECQGSEKKCDGNAVWTCINGKWTKTDACKPQQTCNPTTFVCDDNSNPDITCDKDGEKLALGSTYCGDDKTLYTCVDKDGAGVFEPKTCEGDTPVCGMNGETAACIATSNVKCTKEGDETEYDLGATYCGDDKTLYTCVDKDGSGVFEPKTCEGDTPVCGMNGETAACVAGPAVKCTREGDENEYDLDSTYCGDDGKLYTCTEQEDGAGAFIASDCPAELPVCDLDEGICRAYKTCTVDAKVISHDDKTCVDDVVKLCKDGVLEDETDCAANDQVCDSATSACIDKAPENCTVDSTTIANGATACIGIEKVTCNNGTTTNEACTTTVANASPTCSMVDSAATCGFACNDGYILSDDGSSCVEVAKFDAVLTIREAYDALVDSETCGSGATSNTVKPADVALTGVVTALHSMGFYVQDTTGGIFVSCKDKTCLKYADDTNVAIGDNVKVTSNGVGHYYCDLQVQALKDSSVSIEKLAPAQTVEPTTIALIEDIAQDGARNLNLGKLVVLSGLEAVSPDEHGNWKAKQGDAEINVTPTLIDKDILKTAMNVGKSYGITGIGVYAYNEVRLAPRMREDIVEVVPSECTDGETQCSGANDIQTCTDDGSWAAAVSCVSLITNATTAICETTGDTAVCKATACDGGLVPSEDRLSCVKEPCGESDTLRCNPASKDYQMCSTDGWSAPNPCKGFPYTGDATQATEFACNAANDGCIITACAEGYEPTEDGMGCVVTGTIANNCSLDINGNKPALDSAFCDTETSYKICSLTGNDEGGRACVPDTFCNPDTINSTFKCEPKATTCTDGKMQCSGANDIQTCTDGSWATADSCVSLITNATTATCETTGDTAVCKATACDGGFVVSEDGLSCEAEVVPSECRDGKMQCSGANDIQTCTDGSWATADSCVSLITNATAANCEASGDTAVCKVTACDEGFVPNADNSKCEPTAAPTTSLIISEVASINNSKNHPVKFIEVYNATDAAVSLDGCQLIVHAKSTTYTLDMDGNLEAGKTYIYCNDWVNEAETDADLEAKCSKIFTHTDHMGGMTSRRAIELQCDGNTIDITGKKGDEYNERKTNIIRKCGITSGVTDPNVGAQDADWHSSTPTIEGLKTTLGSHEVVCSE